LKNSENGRSRKFRLLAPNVAGAVHRHGKASTRTTRGKTGRLAEGPLAEF